MILPGTYANGFAPRDGQPLYPSLRCGIIGDWAPLLGESGLVLKDWSGKQRHATIPSNMWDIKSGNKCLTFPGTSNMILTGLNLSGSTLLTLSMWSQRSSISSVSAIISQENLLMQEWSDGNVYYGLGNGQYLYHASNDLTLHSRIMVFDGSQSTDVTKVLVYEDGKPKSLFPYGGAMPASVPSLAGGLQIGGRPNISAYSAASILSVIVWNRALSPNEVRLLATRRGIAYEMAPRRRSQAQVTTNRRRRIIIGGNR